MLSQKLSKHIGTFSKQFPKFKPHFHLRQQSTLSKNNASFSKTFLPLVGGVAIGVGATLLYSTSQKKKEPAIEDSQNGAFLHKVLYNSTIKISDLESPKYGSEPDLQKAIAEIKTIIGDELVTNTESQLEHHTDNGYCPTKPLPEQVPKYIVYATSTEDVSEILQVAHKYSIPIIPFSGGTSLEGHFFTTRPGIVLDTSKMNKILEIHPDDLDAKLQCGVSWNQLNEHLSKTPGCENLVLGCDCGPGAHVCGMIATNASGVGAVKHGSMNNNVISITAVLADGTIFKTKQRPRKTSAGYNLTGLLCGSEGTLAVVTECVVKLQVQNPYETVAVVQFDDLKNCCKSVSAMFKKGLQLEAVEMLDANMMKAVNYCEQITETYDEVPTLFLKISGLNKVVVDELVKEVSKISKENNCTKFLFAKDKDEQEELFAARKNALYIMLDWGYGNIGDIKLWITDVAVPLSKVPDFAMKANKMVEESGLKSVTVAHIGSGNFHIDLYYLENQLERCEKLAKDISKLGIEMEGSVSGEHGIGLGKRELLPLELGPEAIDLMRKLKFSMDPKCILNPDKVIQIDFNEPYPPSKEPLMIE